MTLRNIELLSSSASFSFTLRQNYKLSLLLPLVIKDYLLLHLIKQGLGISAIDSVFKAIVLNKILYALPVLFGYLT